jgi:CRP-like cAMP-binding protein
MIECQPRNRLLCMLGEKERKSILSCMELLEFDIKESLYEPNERIEHAYFPDSGLVSIVSLVQDGSSVEAATIGNEGFVGTPLILGAPTSTTRAFCQIHGHAWRISAADLMREVETNESLSLLLYRYTQSLFDLMAQTAACNQLHSISERCARWLLLTHDRMDSDTFRLTQEFLATILGVRRASVNEVARTLQNAGLINYALGKITILDRKGLEQISCECYPIVRRVLNY